MAGHIYEVNCQMIAGGMVYVPSFMTIGSGIQVIFFSGVGLSPLGTAATSGLLYIQTPDDRWG
jgi:hypothetical protein